MDISLRLPKNYRNIAIGFLSLGAIIFLLTVFISWTYAEILLYPSAQTVEREIVFSVVENPRIVDSKIQVNGAVKVLNLEKTQGFPVTGEKQIETNIVGEVTIYNNYSREQVLVRETRLSAPDDPSTVLVRLNETVTLQPGEQATVEVYPDNPDNFSTLSPMKFIIPGLWEGLREHIYAESVSPLESGGYKVAFAQEADFANIESKMKEELYEQALVEVNDQLQTNQTLWPKLATIERASVSYDANPGDEVNQINATMNMQIRIVAFDEKQVLALAENLDTDSDKMHLQLVNINPDSITYELQSVNAAANEATVKVSLKADSLIAADAEFVDTAKLAGKSEEEIKQYFSQFTGIRDIEVKIRPSWLGKTPKTASRINVKVISGN